MLFPLSSYCFSQHLHPNEDIQDTDCWTISDLRGPFGLGLQAHLQQYRALTALPSASPGALITTASARSTRVCIFAAKTFQAWITSIPDSQLGFAGVINGQCVSPEGCWIHPQGETPLGCHAVNCNQRKILRGYSKRITVLCFSSPKKPSSSLTL